MAGENEIIFEDLRGVSDDETVEVNLDADDEKNHGITRRPSTVEDDDPDDPDAGDDDDPDPDDDPDDDDPDNDDDDDRRAGRDGDDDDDDGAARYSKKVRERIARERRAKEKERERAEYWENKAKEADKRIADTVKREASEKMKRATSQIEEAENALEAAIEAGNTKDQVRLTSRLTDLKAEVIQAKYEIDNAESGSTATADAKVQPNATPEKARRWMDKHADWYGAKGFDRQTRLANRIDKEVFADGFDPNTDEYYRELNRRIRKKEPTLFDDSGRRRSPRRDDSRRRQSPVAGVGTEDSSSRRNTRGSKVELNDADFANMRKFGLDPKDPEVLKEYARNKREVETTSGGRR